MRLQAGQGAPDFLRPDIGGKTIRLSDYRGRYLLLSFYRYASCPFCNLRVHELMQHLVEFDQRGLSLVAVFQSAREGIREHVGKQRPPFPIIPDPGHSMYRSYRVETSLQGLLLGLTLGMGKALKAMGQGFLPGRMEGSITLVPADFLIGPDGTILLAFYGKDISDHLPIEIILQQLGAQRAA
jgi:thioredoxin-dependent peroxiredoxin